MTDIHQDQMYKLTDDLKIRFLIQRKLETKYFYKTFISCGVDGYKRMLLMSAQIMDQIVIREYEETILDVHKKVNVSHGSETKQLGGQLIPRQRKALDLKLESYEFIANEDSNAIEESHRKSVLQYIKV